MPFERAGPAPTRKHLQSTVSSNTRSMNRSPSPTESPDATSTAKGLEGVVALESRLSFIDGGQGELSYAGYDIRDLARNTSFEEVAWLLWKGELPTSSELDSLLHQLGAERTLPPMTEELLRASPENAEPMSVLRTGVSTLALFDGEAESTGEEANLRKATRLTARMPVILAAFDRRRRGREPVRPERTGSTAESFLRLLSGERPGEEAVRTFDACLVLHAEHGLNASTFAARVIGATLSDMYSAITGAIGALKGPLHGGANIRVMEMLEEIDRSGVDPAEHVRGMLARKERIMGFGHRVYKTLDPRADILRDMLEALSEEQGTRKWYDMSMRIMETVKSEKGLHPNVDFFSASVYATLGIPRDLFTPIFAMSRVTGWTAHLLEQWRDNRLIRPRAAYIGPERRSTGRSGG